MAKSKVHQPTPKPKKLAPAAVEIRADTEPPANLTIGETASAVTPAEAPVVPRGVPATAPVVTELEISSIQIAPPNLADLEQIISSGLRTFVDVGQALTRIRDGQLYRATHASFEAYCVAKWDFSRARAYQFIAASAVVERVNNCRQPLPAVAHESQARELARLPAKEQPKAWAAAVKAAPDGVVTAKHVAAIVAARLPEPSLRPKVKPKLVTHEVPVALPVAPLDPEAAFAEALDRLVAGYSLGHERLVAALKAAAQRARGISVKQAATG